MSLLSVSFLAQRGENEVDLQFFSFDVGRPLIFVIVILLDFGHAQSWLYL